MNSSVPPADTVLRAMTDDGAFRVMVARTTDTVRAIVAAQQVDGFAANQLGDLVTAAVLVRETMSPPNRVQVLLRCGRDSLGVGVVENDGGGIFSCPQPATELATDRFERLYGTPHGLDLLALAAAFGLRAERVRTPSELAAALRSPGQGGPMVVVVNSDRAANTEVHAELNGQVAAALAALGPGRAGARAGA